MQRVSDSGLSVEEHASVRLQSSDRRLLKAGLGVEGSRLTVAFTSLLTATTTDAGAAAGAAAIAAGGAGMQCCCCLCSDSLELSLSLSVFLSLALSRIANVRGRSRVANGWLAMPAI